MLVGGAGETWDVARVTAAVDVLGARLAGSRVLAVLADNSPAWVVVDLAAQQAGVVHLPLPAFFSDAQMAHALSQSAADSLLTDQPERIGRLDLGFLPARRVAGTDPDAARHAGGRVAAGNGQNFLHFRQYRCAEGRLSERRRPARHGAGGARPLARSAVDPPSVRAAAGLAAGKRRRRLRPCCAACRYICRRSPNSAGRAGRVDPAALNAAADRVQPASVHPGAGTAQGMDRILLIRRSTAGIAGFCRRRRCPGGRRAADPGAGGGDSGLSGLWPDRSRFGDLPESSGR